MKKSDGPFDLPLPFDVFSSLSVHVLAFASSGSSSLGTLLHLRECACNVVHGRHGCVHFSIVWLE